MKAFIAAFTSWGKSVMNILLHPVGPIAAEFSPYEPVDKPVLCFETLLFLSALVFLLLAKVTARWITSETRWPWLRIGGIAAQFLLLFISLVGLLFPPRGAQGAPLHSHGGNGRYLEGFDIIQQNPSTSAR